MSVNIGENGRRSVQAEVEVPGSPEQVWQAIATGPGISSWFVPTTVEERVGGAFTADFGMGIESTSTITEWEPPHRFVKDGDGMGENAPPVATEWIVEAKSGGTCVVRVVHSWFASTDDWDGEWESVEKGWVDFFNILRLALTHFPGQPCSAFDAAGMGDADAWAALTGPLGLTDVASGQEVKNELLAGKVAIASHGDEKQVMLLTSEPGTGICHVSAMPFGGPMYVAIRFYLFGDGAAAAAAKAGPEWTAWFAERFPMGG